MTPPPRTSKESSLYIVLLRFASNKDAAANHMAGHQAWIQQGLDDGVFMLVGSLPPGQGGAIVAHGTSADELHARVGADPFVAHEVVSAEIVEIAPNATDPRLAFLAS